MTDQIQQVLLPCPFCGCSATLRIGQSMFVDTHVTCEVCLAEGPGFCYDEEDGDFTNEAIEAWNRRTAPEGFMLVPVEPTREMLEAGRAAVMAARVASKKWTPRQHYEASGRSMAGIPKDVLDEHGTLTKESEAVMVFGSMIAHRPGGEAHEH